MANAADYTRARSKGVSPLLYWPVRVSFQLFFLVYFRMARIGREHIPKHGPAIIASNHRSFFDPFLIACMARRPMYYVAKRELFEINPLISLLLRTLGAFPVDRGNGDRDTIVTAKELLARGELVLIFPEGTRTRPGPLGKPRRGVGRLALESGVPIIPVALIGTESIRRGWRIRPRKVRVRAGRALSFPHVDVSTPVAAAIVTERVWECVKLQWAWLGGAVEPQPAPVREAVRAA
ncbi:MAG TPA: lysophospholipid acyltransferase family protein [Solirubrobacteraceae bacterium]|nr:lysophospholipid acyltransferase family protein [Solirubrobacteraceae bacterium]